MQQSTKFFLGLDLGQAQDYTAIGILQKIPIEDSGHQYHLRHLQRFALGTTYPDIIQAVGLLIEQNPLRKQTSLIVDQTGVGSQSDLASDRGDGSRPSLLQIPRFRGF